jgi:hypothetical protein
MSDNGIEQAERMTHILGDVLKSVDFPEPEAIRADSATCVAVALAEERLNISMIDASFWQDLLTTRGGTHICALLWAYVNQESVAESGEPRWTERDVQARVPARRVLDYLEALSRAYGQEDFADAFARLRNQQQATLHLRTERDERPMQTGTHPTTNGVPTCDTV